MFRKIIIIIVVSSALIFSQDPADYCSLGKIKAFQRLNKSNIVLYPGDGNIDVTYYKLILNIDYQSKFLTGVVTVKAKSVKNNLQNFYLDLYDSMNVSSVTTGGASLSFLHSGNQLQITLDKQYQSGQEFSVEISYSGYPKSGNFGDFVFSTHGSLSQPVVWSLSEPYGAKAWWPGKDTPADKADSSEVWITADNYFVSVSNGKLIGTVDNPDGTKTYKWKNSYPIANYLISIAMSNYRIYDTPLQHSTNKTMPVTHYVYPEQFDAAKTNLDLVNGMITIFSDKFGLYPFINEKYGQAQCHNGVSMEHQTVSSMSTFDENIEAHELAHQWFGDKVTCKDWQNIWLNEGFASYCECIYREIKYGSNDFKNYVNNFMIRAKYALGTINVQDIGNVWEIFNSNRSYKKGAIVLHMLRGIVGDSKFFQILKEYLVEPGLSYNVATTEDFQRIAERVYGQTLDYFFKEWIYGDSYPKYTIETSYNFISDNNYNVTVRLIQTQNPSGNPIFFKMPVQIRITTPSGIVNTIVFNDTQVQAWSIPVTGQPSKIEVDPDNWILKDVVATTSIEDEKEIPAAFSLSQNYPNPFNPTTLINYKIPFGSNVSLKIYDELGKEVVTLVDEFKQAGSYRTEFSTGGLKLASGIYYYTLQALTPSAGQGHSFSETKKMIFLK